MSTELNFELCPETGVGCLLMKGSSGTLKLDLMPDEAARLKELIDAGDLEGAKALLVSVDPGASAALEGVGLQALAKELG